MWSEPFEYYISNHKKDAYKCPEVDGQGGFFPKTDTINKCIAITLGYIIYGVDFKNKMKA